MKTSNFGALQHNSMIINKMEKQHTEQVESGERFKFGANWASFIDSLDDDRLHVVFSKASE